MEDDADRIPSGSLMRFKGESPFQKVEIIEIISIISEKSHSWFTILCCLVTDKNLVCLPACCLFSPFLKHSYDGL